MYLSVLAVILPALVEETRWVVLFALKLSASLPPSRLASSLQLDWFSLLTLVHTISMGTAGARRLELALVDCRCCFGIGSILEVLAASSTTGAFCVADDGSPCAVRSGAVAADAALAKRVVDCVAGCKERMIWRCCSISARSDGGNPRLCRVDRLSWLTLEMYWARISFSFRLSRVY